jgi:hypothetical protein
MALHFIHYPGDSTVMKSRKSSAFLILVLGCAVAIMAGCDHSPETATAPASSSAHARFVAVAPSDAELAKMNLKYATFKPAPDGTYFDFVPLPPKSGDVIVGIDTPGSYTVKLSDPKCAFDVRMAPSEGGAFVLNAAAPSHPFTLAKAGQLKSAMSDTATNNYFCNVSLAPI